MHPCIEMGDVILVISVENFIKSLLSSANAVFASKDMLTELDAAIGDGDHGINLDRGFKTVKEKIEGKSYTAFSELLRDVAKALLFSVGGASGPLYGQFFLKMGMKLGSKPEATLEEFANAVAAGVGGVKSIGKGERFDKTMLDVLIPFSEVLNACIVEKVPHAECLKRSLKAAREGRDETINLIARKGRASYLGKRSLGHMDPGAASSFLILEAMCQALLSVETDR